MCQHMISIADHSRETVVLMVKVQYIYINIAIATYNVVYNCQFTLTGAVASLNVCTEIKLTVQKYISLCTDYSVMSCLESLALVATA